MKSTHEPCKENITFLSLIVKLSKRHSTADVNDTNQRSTFTLVLPIQIKPKYQLSTGQC